MKKFIKGCLTMAGIFVGIGIVIGMVVSVIAGQNLFNIFREQRFSWGPVFSSDIQDSVVWEWGDRTFGDWIFEDWEEEIADLTVNNDIISSHELETIIISSGVTKISLAVGGSFRLEEWEEENFGINVNGRGECEYYVEDGCFYVEAFYGLANTDDNEMTVYLPEDKIFEEINLAITGGRTEVDIDRADSLICQTDAGEAVFSEIEANYIELGTRGGWLEFEGRAGENMNVDCSGGGVHIQLQDRERDYNYSLSCDAGSIVLDDQDYSMLSGRKYIDNGAKRELSVQCSAGSVEVEFE